MKVGLQVLFDRLLHLAVIGVALQPFLLVIEVILRKGAPQPTTLDSVVVAVVQVAPAVVDVEVVSQVQLNGLRVVLFAQLIDRGVQHSDFPEFFVLKLEAQV